jgi:predicted GTPase
MNTEDSTLDISIYKKRAEELKAKNYSDRKKVVANAGLLKAGKSTLFNALVGKDLFPSDVVRATVENKTEELEHYFLIDTPGLDACEEDTREALAGYADADAIIFVHNLQEGELNQTEIDSINHICELFGDRDVFFKNVILVLSHKDQVEKQYIDIRNHIDEQCDNILQNRFFNTFCVDSAGYLKGLTENKDLLKKDSGIPELMEMVETCISDEYELQGARLEKEKNQLIADIDNTISNLIQSMQKGDETSVSNIETALTRVKEISEKAVESVRGRTISWAVNRSFKYLSSHDRDYKQYESKSSAKSAGKSAIEKSIRAIYKAAKKSALEAVERAESGISFSEIPKELLDHLSDAYEEIRQCTLNAGITIQTNYSVALHDNSKINDAYDKLKYVRSYAKGISSDDFSVSKYVDYMEIDYDETTKWVKGLFGNEKAKTVTVYLYDISDSNYWIADRATDLVDDAIDQAQDAVSYAFSAIKKDLTTQFERLTDDIIAELNLKMNEVKQKEQTFRQKQHEIQQQINELENCKNDVVALR